MESISTQGGGGGGGGRRWTISFWGGVGCSLSVLREGGRHTVVTEGGVEDELLVGREWWAVVVFANATG